MRRETRFLIINVVGGAAVLGSYVWGLLSYTDLRDTMWGGVSEAWRGV